MTATITIDQAFLFDFILTLLSALLRYSNCRQANVYAFRAHFTRKNLPLPFVHLKNRTTKTSIGIEILQSLGVKLFVREQSSYLANVIGTPPTCFSCSPTVSF